MSIFEIDCQSVTLSGIILSGHLTLRNPHELLAVIFEVESLPPFLDIEPMRGMIMQGESKIIRLRCKNEARASLNSIEKEAKQLVVRGSYYSEYNKKVMAKNNLKGWSLLSKKLQETPLPIFFNLAEEIQKAREEAHRSNSLRNSRKMNSFEKFRQSSIKRVKNERLNEDLDFIFRNEEFKKIYESKYSQKHPQQGRKSNTAPQLFENIKKLQQEKEHIYTSPLQSPIQRSRVEPPTKSTPIIRAPASKDNIPKVGQGVMERGNGKERRGMDLMILAIIAALFLSLGEGMGQHLKY